MPTSQPLDVCIATADFVGPIRNGGIGTAYHALALALRDAGHRVCVLYGLGDWSEKGKIEDWVEHYRDINIEFVPVPPSPDRLSGCCPYVRYSYECYLWLAEREKQGRPFDVIHFHEWRGLGFHTTLARRQGLAFAKPIICIGTHSPHLWHQWGMHQHPVDLNDLQADFIERSSVKNADALISPSQYMIDWMKSQGWELPAETHVRQNILANVMGGKPAKSKSTEAVSDIVYFGRLEKRKGLILFCDALDSLAADADWAKKHQDLTITFLGKATEVEGLPGDAYLGDRGRKWPWVRRIIPDYGHAEALDFLCHPGRLAVMPSLLENSPYTVLECLGHGVSFLCTDLPGNRELIAPADQDRVLFTPRPALLAQKLRETIDAGSRPAAPAVDPEQTRQEWIRWHEEIAGKIPGPIISHETPLVTICLVHRNRPTMLAQGLESLRAQDYPNMQIVLVDDGSDKPDAIEFLKSLEEEFATKKWKLIRQSNRYLGAARNAAAAAADGQWLLFMDDDNFAAPDEISTFVHAAQCSGADVMTCFAACFQGDSPPVAGVTERELWLPLGGAVAVGLFLNLYGDANGIYRREVFRKLGGFSEDYGIGHEDWELYAKAALLGYKVQVVPRALFWYRVHPTSMLRTTNHFVNHMRSLRPYLNIAGPELSAALLLAQSMYFTPAQKSIPPAEESTMPTANVPQREFGDPQKLVDEYWDSLSWRVTRPGRALFSLFAHVPNSGRPHVQTHREAQDVIQTIRKSISWEATGPLRAMARAVDKMRGSNGIHPGQT